MYAGIRGEAEYVAAALTLPLPATGDRPVPWGRRVELARRGTTFLREVPGPPGAPTLLLLHGWGASGALNWFRAFEPLSSQFRLVAPDLRGHARGLRSPKVFRLADCADDCAATLLELGTGPVIAVGYSMGGPVAQLLWRRHHDLVSGLVLCATTAGFFPNRSSRLWFQGSLFAAITAMRAGALARIPAAIPGVVLGRSGNLTWPAAEMRRHDWRMLLEAGHSLSTYYAGRWIGQIDVPTAVVCTTEDRGVAPELQLATAEAIRGATVHRVADGHLACANPSFVEPLRRACAEVADRAG
jgi:pimeloyl-ACP methyl ester carboxylesterase